MLKLEKALNNREVNVIFRDKEHFFNRPLLIAFAFAAGFHLIFLVVFQVTPFKIRWNETIFPPTHVDADASFQDLALLVDVAAPKKTRSGLPPAQPSSPLISKHPSYSSPLHPESIMANHNFANPFTQIEKNIYEPTFKLTTAPSGTAITLIIAGPLATRPLLRGNPLHKKIPTFKGPQESSPLKRIRFSVLVAQDSGRIFWYEPLELSKIATLDHFAEVLLQDLQFSPHEMSFIMAGEVEFHLNTALEAAKGTP